MAPKRAQESARLLTAVKADARFTDALMTPTGAGIHLGIPAATVRLWARRDRPVIHAVPPASKTAPSLPFIALAEAQILRQLRAVGLPMQHIRAGVQQLQQSTGEQYVLARNDIATDSGVLLYNAATKMAPDWVQAKDGQAVFRQVAEALFKFVSYASDGYASRLHLKPYGSAEVIIDPRFGWGQPVLAGTKVPVEVVADLFYAGESLEDIAKEYDITAEQVETIVRVTGKRVTAA